MNKTELKAVFLSHAEIVRLVGLNATDNERTDQNLAHGIEKKLMAAKPVSDTEEIKAVLIDLAVDGEVGA